MPARPAPRRVNATRPLAALALTLAPASLAQIGVSTQPADIPAVVAQPVESSAPPALPSAGATLDAYRAVDAWLRAGFAAPTDPQPLDPAGTTAACVTIRLSGAVLGRATEPADGAARSAWAAARRAMLEALERAPAPSDATREDVLLEVAQRATLDIQLAGRLTPLLGDTFADAALQLSPGLDGVAIRVGERLALVFPGTMLSTNSTALDALRACAGQLGLPPVELATLRRDHNAIVYRFRAQHVAQPLAGREPIFLFRGGQTVPPTDVSLSRLAEFAHGLAARFANLRYAGDAPLGLRGDYQPWNATHSPPIASPREQALALYALARYASSPAIDAANRARAARTFWTLAADLAAVVEGEQRVLEDPIAAAFATLALRAAPERPPGMPRPSANPSDLSVAGLLAVRDSFDPAAGWGESLRPGERAAIAFALADGAREHPERSDLRTRAELAVRSLFREATPGTLVAYMPWLLHAELALAGDGAVLSLPALLELRDLVWRHQLAFADVGADNPDLLGGIVFTAARTPLPTAQLTRPLAAIATMTFDPRFTPSDQFAGELARLTASLRFVRQLAVDDALLHMMRDERASRWGIRASPWDQTLTVDASAMALLTLVETLEGAHAR